MATEVQAQGWGVVGLLPFATLVIFPTFAHRKEAGDCSVTGNKEAAVLLNTRLGSCLREYSTEESEPHEAVGTRSVNNGFQKQETQKRTFLRLSAMFTGI